jgi:hypothetical protein
MANRPVLLPLLAAGLAAGFFGASTANRARGLKLQIFRSGPELIVTRSSSTMNGIPVTPKRSLEPGRPPQLPALRPAVSRLAREVEPSRGHARAIRPRVGAPSARVLAAKYDLIVFPGHHEYVTTREYDLVEGYRNLAGT